MLRFMIILFLTLCLLASTNADENNLAVQLKDFVYDNHLSGPKFSNDDLAGKVVMVEFWGIRCVPCLKAMPHLNKLYDELRDFGLVILAPHAQEGSPHQVKSKVTSYSMMFSVYGAGTIREDNPFKFIPHTILFDHTGQCVYRGKPTEVEARLRIAVGKALVARTGLKQFTKTMTPYAEALASGQSPYFVLGKLNALIKSKNSDKASAEQANLLVSKMIEDVQKMLDRAGDDWQSAPMETYDQLNRVAYYFKGTQLAIKASQTLTKIKTEKAVQLELKARPSLEQIKQLDAGLCNEIKGDVLPTGQEFRAAFGTQLLQMKNLLTQMKKSWPTAKATEQAMDIALYYQIEPGK